MLPRRARVRDRVVDPVDVLHDGRRGVEGADRPDLLVVRDVAQVPDDRAHEGAVLAGELLVGERLDQLERAGARGGEVRARRALAAGRRRAPVAQPHRQDGERLRRVDEHAHRLEAEAGGVGGHLVDLELAADLGQHHLAARQAEAPPEVRQLDHLRAHEAGGDLDPIELVVVVGDVLDRAQVEARAELAVHAREEVLGEGLAPARAIVVRRLERTHVFHQVDADQEVVARAERGRHAVEEVGRLLRVQVADRAPEEDEDERREVAQEREGALVGGGDAAHLEPG